MKDFTKNERTAFISQVAQALNAPGLASELTRLSHDQDRRVPWPVRPTVVTATEDHDLKGLIPPGSVLLMFAPCGSEALRGIEAAFIADDADSLRVYQSQLPELLRQRSVLTMTDAVGKVIASPSYFDFRYGSKPLAVGATLVDDLDLGSLLFITNGGALRSEDFAIIEYHRAAQPSSPIYDYLVVHREGRLTELERTVLAAVPPNELEFNISAVGPVAIWPAVIVWVALVTLTGSACLQLERELSRIKLTPEQVKKLGARASARELLAMRREVQERLGAG